MGLLANPELGHTSLYGQEACAPRRSVRDGEWVHKSRLIQRSRERKNRLHEFKGSGRLVCFLSHSARLKKDSAWKGHVHSRQPRSRENEHLIQTKFDALADQWERETRHIASPKKIAFHPLVRELVKIGKPAIPLILNRMKRRPWFWFHALMELSEEEINPITPEMRGDMQRMTEAWLQWGEGHGII